MQDSGVEEMTITNVQLHLIKELRGNGFTQQEIADVLGVSRKTVENHLRKLRVNYKPLPKEAYDLIAKASDILVKLVNDYDKDKKEQQGYA